MTTVVAYTLAPWNHALAVLRLVAPLRKAGLRLIHGNTNGDIHAERVSQADLVVIQRDFPINLKEYEQIVLLARQQSKPVILDLDDWLLELPEDHPDRISHHYAGSLFPILRALVEADAVTVGTAQLGEHLSVLNRNTLVLPNYIDEDIWDVCPPKPLAAESLPVRLVYMGGDTHTPDLTPLLPVLEQLLRSYPERVSLHFLGMLPDPALSSYTNVTSTPFQMDYASYARSAAENGFDLGIAPLANNVFNRCKSPIKYLEYSTLGIPGVYSNIPPYAGVVKDGENGFLATAPEEWLRAISALIEKPALRYRIGLAAQETVRQHWLLSSHAQEWAQTYQKIASQPRNHEIVCTIPVSLFVGITHQTHAWQTTLQTDRSAKDAEIDGLNNKLAEQEGSIRAFSGQVAPQPSNISARLNRWMGRISSRLRSKPGKPGR